MGRRELSDPMASMLGDWLLIFFAPEIRAWRGQMTLWKVYWGYGVAVSWLLALALGAALLARATLLTQALLVALAAYTVWILVAVWRCAGHTRQPWSFLARLSTIAWAGNATLVLGFLQIELLARL